MADRQTHRSQRNYLPEQRRGRLPLPNSQKTTGRQLTCKQFITPVSSKMPCTRAIPEGNGIFFVPAKENSNQKHLTPTAHRANFERLKDWLGDPRSVFL